MSLSARIVSDIVAAATVVSRSGSVIERRQKLATVISAKIM